MFTPALLIGSILTTNATIGINIPIPMHLHKFIVQFITQVLWKSILPKKMILSP